MLLGKEWWRYDKDAFFKGCEKRIDDGYSEFDWDHSANPAHRASAYARWLRDEGCVREKPPREDCQFVQVGYPTEHHQATWCADRTISFIERFADTWHPWVYSVNIFDPHYAPASGRTRW